MCISTLTMPASISCHARAKVPYQSGISLVELIVFVIIVSVGIAGILAVMNVTVKSSADPMLRKQAVALAEAVLDEVLAKDYIPGGTSFTSCTGTDHAQYDDVDDYNNCSGGASVITGADTLGAAPIAALASYKATVSVAPVTVNGAAMKKVTVTVTGGAETIQLSGYRGQY